MVFPNKGRMETAIPLLLVYLSESKAETGQRTPMMIMHSMGANVFEEDRTGRFKRISTLLLM